VALAEEGRQGEVRFLGDIDNTPNAMKRLVRKLSGKYLQLLFCYEAGPTGYGLHRRSLLSDTIVQLARAP
jgi:transposase